MAHTAAAIRAVKAKVVVLESNLMPTWDELQLAQAAVGKHAAVIKELRTRAAPEVQAPEVQASTILAKKGPAHNTIMVSLYVS
jgi:hypothetical protein